MFLPWFHFVCTNSPCRCLQLHYSHLMLEEQLDVGLNSSCPHLTIKIFVLFYDHALRAQTFCPHMEQQQQQRGRAVEMFAEVGVWGVF